MKSKDEKLLLYYSYCDTYQQLIDVLITQNRNLLNLVEELTCQLDYIKEELIND